MRYNEDMREWEHQSQKHWTTHIADSLLTLAICFKWSRVQLQNQITNEHNIFAINIRAKEEEEESSATAY